MRFSLYINPQTPGPAADRDIIKAAAETAVIADRAGFAGICLTQHHFSNYNTYGNSVQFGSYLAGQVKQAWLLLQVAVVPLYNPLVMVEDLNLLDQLWDGRLIVGLGSGGSPLEFEGMGRDPMTRHKVMSEVMSVAHRAWAHQPGDAPLEFETTHDRGVMRGRIMPASVRKPHPLLARAAIRPGSWGEAGKQGVPLFFGRVGLDGAKQAMADYNAGLEQSSLSAEQKEFCRAWTTMQKTVMIAQSDAEAQAAIDEPLSNLHRLSMAAFAAYGDEQRKAVTGVSGDDPAAFRKAFVEGATIIGSPETFTQRLREYETAGVQHVALHMNFGFMDPAVTRRSLELFIEKVMPQFEQKKRESAA